MTLLAISRRKRGLTRLKWKMLPMLVLPREPTVGDTILSKMYMVCVLSLQGQGDS